ncbi:MAG: hypothetical protein RL427_472 [Bacteroidota bacterium]|jgi:hypothetical protein
MIKSFPTSEVEKASKLIVYDTSRGFSRFIKSKFEEQFEVIVISSPQEIRKYKTDDLGVLLFIVNDGVDAILFSNIFYNTKHVFLGIAAKHLEDRFLNYKNVKQIDLELPKKELFLYLNQHLQTA